MGCPMSFKITWKFCWIEALKMTSVYRILKKTMLLIVSEIQKNKLYFSYL